MRRLTVLALLSIVWVLGCRHATPPRAAQPEGRDTAVALQGPYLGGEAFNYKALLPAPPADGSAVHRGEIDQMLELQARRTPDEIRRCQSEEEVTVFTFAPAVGPWFTPE